MNLYPFQERGARWLRQNPRAVLADQMGCVEGDAVIPVNRAGVCRYYTLRNLYAKERDRMRLRRVRGSLWSWRIPTRVRALCNGEIRLHTIEAVIAKGDRRVLRLTLASGKSLRLTPDHEVCVGPEKFVRVDSLKPGDTVLTNGRPRCLRCGSTKDVATYRYGSFPGYCKVCIYRHLRKNRLKAGTTFSKEGYVLVPRQYDHPRANKGYLVYEHILVMEDLLGRPLRRDEVVHLKNGDKADNRPANLSLMSKSGHMTHHGRDGGYRKLDGGRGGKGGLVLFEPIVDTVKSVEDGGVTDVYDIVCKDPHRNFVANGIIVHNCGKTPQALMALPSNASTLLVCPAVMKHVWHDECLRWRPDLTPVVLKGRNSLVRWPNPGEILICNYDILPAHFPAGIPNWLFLVCDEAHYLKTSQALRTKKVRALSRMARTVWFLTGTAMLNEPLDLWNVLEGAGLARTAFGDFAGWMRLFQAKQIDLGSSRPGGKRWRKWVYGRVDSSVPERLRRVMLRRRREDVLPELPVKTYHDVEVDLDDDEARRLCDEAAEQLLAAGIDISEARDRADIDSISGEVLGALSKARAALSEAKLPWAVELCESLQAQDEPVVFFSSHRAPVEFMAKYPGWGKILGGIPAEERNDLVSRFQSGELKGLALTIGAGGVGITLTKAAHAVFVDLDWVPALNSQAEDRLVRIGQTRGVVVHRIIADHPVDRWVTKALARKQALIEASMEAATVRG